MCAMRVADAIIAAWLRSCPSQTHRAPGTAWDKVLTDGHASLVRARRLFRYLPSAPRCKVCNNPFGGVAGRILAAAGFTPSRKNPNLCSRCCDALPAGGAEVDIAVLFADVRGSTALGRRARRDRLRRACSTGSTSRRRGPCCATTP